MQNRRIVIQACIVIVVLLNSCSQVENYDTAYGIIENGQAFIKLKGKRASMAHDLGSLNNYYEDSILIPVPSLKDGIIEGKDIITKIGYYKYLGTIKIDGNHLIVNLSYDDTDDQKIRESSWNDEYDLVK